MNLKQLQASITAYRAEATEQELESLSQMLSHELNTTDERLEEIETERQDAIEKAELKAWQESPEGKEEAEYFRNAITLWYRTEDNIVTVDGDRRRPNEWEICIEDRLGYQMHKLIGTQVEAQSYVENIVGTGTAYTPNENAGAKRWRFRWYSYHNDQWLDQATPQQIPKNQHQSIPQSSLAEHSLNARESAKNSSPRQAENKRTGNIELQHNRTPFSESGPLLCLAAVSSAKRILETVGKDTFSTKDYYLNRRGETMTIDALDGRGEIARISDGVVTGNVSTSDISNLNDLEKTVRLNQTQPQQQRQSEQKPNLNTDWEIGD